LASIGDHRPSARGGRQVARLHVALYDELVSRKADRHTAIVALGGGVVRRCGTPPPHARGLYDGPDNLPRGWTARSGQGQDQSCRGQNIIGRSTNRWGLDRHPTLQTLPIVSFAGLAEVVKYGVILDAEFRGAGVSVREDPEPARRRLRRIVARSCRLKAGVVAGDEREETGLRAVLNFGHTVATPRGSRQLWGLLAAEAVAVGMVAECRLAPPYWIDPTHGSSDQLAGALGAADAGRWARSRPADRGHGAG
jgi:3-dehydroquinate synthase